LKKDLHLGTKIKSNECLDIWTEGVVNTNSSSKTTVIPSVIDFFIWIFGEIKMVD